SDLARGCRPGHARSHPAAADRRYRAGPHALPLRGPADRHRGGDGADRRPLVRLRLPAPRPRGGYAIIHAMPSKTRQHDLPEQPSLPFQDPPDGVPPPGGAEPRGGPRRRVPAGDGRPWWARLLGGLLAPWIELKIAPPEGLPPDPRPTCYVLEDYGLSNALILDRACRKAGLPSPLRPLPGDPLGRKRAYVALSRRNAGSTLGRAATLATGRNAPLQRHSDSLARLLEAHRADPAMDVRLVPVSIFV